MATGHWDPGYGDPVSRLRGDRGRRAQSAGPPGAHAGARQLQATLGLHMDACTLEGIKERARLAWLKKSNSETSYQDHYQDKLQDLDEPTYARPTSAGRRNKPHPPEVFLTTHLHSLHEYGRLNEIPGYHDPDTTVGKSPYRVDGSAPISDWRTRPDDYRSKYIGRPSTAAVAQYRTNKSLSGVIDPMERQASEAWLKLSQNKDKDDALFNLREQNIWNEAPSIQYGYSTAPSLHRYLRGAGAEETAYLDGINSKYAGGLPRPPSATVGARGQGDRDNMRTVKYVHRTKRGDFLMHPDWPPSIHHHRLNGLSSVDVPYFPGRR